MDRTVHISILIMRTDKSKRGISPRGIFGSCTWTPGISPDEESYWDVAVAAAVSCSIPDPPPSAYLGRSWLKWAEVHRFQGSSPNGPEVHGSPNSNVLAETGQKSMGYQVLTQKGQKSTGSKVGSSVFPDSPVHRIVISSIFPDSRVLKMVEPSVFPDSQSGGSSFETQNGLFGTDSKSETTFRYILEYPWVVPPVCHI